MQHKIVTVTLIFIHHMFTKQQTEVSRKKYTYYE
jgi:hypothetical protein